MSALFRRTSPITRCFSTSAMRPDLNKVQLIGRIGSTPSSNEVNNRRVYNYTVATSEVRPDKEGNVVKRTQWHRVAYWTSSEWFNKVKKGDLVYVEGTLRYNEYTDKEGQLKTKAEIQQSSFRLLTPKRESEEEEEE